MKKILFYFSLSFFIFSCSKEREEQNKSYTNATEFYENNKEEEQEFIIETDEGDCIVAKKGTVICGSRTQLRTSSNETVTLPYTLKVVELYSIKDHLLYNFPTTASGIALKNDGSVRVKAVKDGNETSLISTGRFTAKYSVDPSMTSNKIFRGTMTDDSFSDWELAIDGSSISKSGSRDSLRLATFGWFQAAQNTYNTNYTTVNFELDGTGGEDLDLWLVHKSNNTLMHGKNLKITNVPIGESVTAIVIALDKDKNLVFHESSFTVTDKKIVTIDFKEIKENALLNDLENL